MSFKKRPVFFAYTVHLVEGRDVWEQIGSAYAHDGRTGFNVLFDKLPACDASGRFKIVLRGARSYTPPKPALDAPAVPDTACHSLTLQGGGGICSACNGAGFIELKTRGPSPCPACRRGNGGS